MATTYDPTIIQQFADQLYAQAGRIVAVYAGLGVLMGGAGGAMVGMIPMLGWNPVVPSLALALVFGVLFGLVGRSRSFDLRLKAQTALCQLQIEWNLRRR